MTRTTLSSTRWFGAAAVAAVTAAVAAVTAAVAAPAPAQTGRTLNAAPNPSFETAAQGTPGWRLHGSAIAAGRARSGRLRLLADARGGIATAAVSAPVPVDPAQSYRVSGWIRAAGGRGRLWLTLADETGRALARTATPWVARAPAWRYTAAELDLPPAAREARITFEQQGGAELDDVALVPMKSNLVFNPGMDPDSKGRIGLWSEETADVLAGKRAGAVSADPAGVRGGALRVTAAAGAWAGARMVAATVVEGATAYRCRGWVRGARSARLSVLWMDRFDRVIQTDSGPTGTGGAGWRLQQARMVAPRSARYVTVVATVQGGAASFDDVWLAPDAPASLRIPFARVLANQVGCERFGPKSVVVATNFFPRGSSRGEVTITTPRGAPVLRVPMDAERIHDAASADWGSYYWRADFSALTRPGSYVAVAAVGGVRGRSGPFTVSEDANLRGTGRLGVEFFHVQRCGTAVPGWHAPCHLDDALLPGGAHIEATGGWHSAGDYNKLMYENGDGGVAFALLEAYDALPACFQHDRRAPGHPPAIIDEALWGARFVAKMQNPATGGLYKDIRQGPARTWMKWSSPETHTDNVIGTADDPVIDAGEGSSPLVIPVWMRLASAPGDGDTRATATNADLARRAELYWRRLRDQNATGASPVVLLAAIQMAARHAHADARAAASRWASVLLQQQVRTGRFAGGWGTSGEITAGALASYALAFPRDPLSPAIRAAMPAFSRFLRSTAANPFGLSQQSVGDRDYFFEPTSTMGTNFVQLQKAWAAALIYRLTGDRESLRFAVDQVDWVLGKNPYGLCQMEGAGTLNPPRYHHRYDAIPGHERGAVPGAIPNGFVRTISSEDQPGFDLSEPAPGKRHPSYRTSEPWLVHNMWHLMAMAALHGIEAPAGTHRRR